MLSDSTIPARMYEELCAAQEEGIEPMETARRWKRSEMVRIGIEDVMALVDLEQTHVEMTSLAEACLRFAVENAKRVRKRKNCPLVVIGMGKFCGRVGCDVGVAGLVVVLLGRGMSGASHGRGGGTVGGGEGSFDLACLLAVEFR